jgi:hypothetical protein
MAEERLFQVFIINTAPKHNDYFAGVEIKNQNSEGVYAMHNKKSHHTSIECDVMPLSSKKYR